MQKEVRDLKSENQSLRKVIGSPSTIVAAEEVVKNQQSTSVRKKETLVPIEEGQDFLGWDKVPKKKANKSHTNHQESDLSTSNRYSVLGTLENETSLIQVFLEKGKKENGKENSHNKPQQHPAKKTSKLNTSNRFALVSDKETKTFLIGDSLVKGQEAYFVKFRQGLRKVRSFPGAQTAKIAAEIEKISLKTRETTVSGNDLFLKNNRLGNTENNNW